MAVRVIPVDIYDFAKEIELIQALTKGTYLGIVSLSPGLLRATEVIIHSLRGEEVLVMTAQLTDSYKINAIVRSARVILCDQASYETVKEAVITNRDDIIRPPQLICCENYISTDSINLLKRELGLK
jgi:GntR family transcriptional regulator